MDARVIDNHIVDGRSIPTPKRKFLIGNVGDFARNPLEYLQKVAAEFGDVVHLKFGMRHMYLLNHPEYIREVLVTKPISFRKGLALRYAKAVLGEGLLTSEGETHRRHRRMMQPAFHMRRVREYADTMVDYADEMVSAWTSGEERLISTDMMDVTLRIIAKTMFGYETRAETETIARAMDNFMEFVMHRVQSVVRIPDFVPTNRRQEFRRMAASLDEIIYRIIATRRVEPEADTGDLMSMLLKARDETGTVGMTDEELRDEVMTIFLAGHETTANTLSWTWYLLSQNPHAEERLHEELDRVLAGRRPTMEDLGELVYLNQVIKESMRLYPAAWSVGYQAIEDVQIGHWNFHKGDGFLMSQYVMHRNPLYYDRPDSFIPERWTEEFSKSLPPFAYFPFGGGPRICIGNQFALMEAALILAAIAQRYRMEYVGSDWPIPLPQITLRSANGIRMRIIARR